MSNLKGIYFTERSWPYDFQDASKLCSSFSNHFIDKKMSMQDEDDPFVRDPFAASSIGEIS